MAGHKVSFAGRIRDAAQQLRRGPFTYAVLSAAAGLQSSADEAKMRLTVRDFLRRGEMARIDPGVFRYVGRPQDALLAEKRRVMWRLLKMRRLVTIEDMEELAGVSKEYGLEWLRNLHKQGVVDKIAGPTITAPCKWRLIKDVAHMPEDEAQKAKYRAIRKKKKEVLAKVLDDIQAGINKARTVLEDDI